MNRTLSRARTIDGDWVEGFFIKNVVCNHAGNSVVRDIVISPTSQIKNGDSEFAKVKYSYVDSNTVCRFSETIDEDYDKIFEGDIVIDSEHKENGFGLVMLTQNKFQVCFKGGGGLIGWFVNSADKRRSTLKKIGNRIENLELLPKEVVEDFKRNLKESVKNLN